jgi:hypothetical protein
MRVVVTFQTATGPRFAAIRPLGHTTVRQGWSRLVALEARLREWWSRAANAEQFFSDSTVPNEHQVTSQPLRSLVLASARVPVVTSGIAMVLNVTLTSDFIGVPLIIAGAALVSAFLRAAPLLRYREPPARITSATARSAG